MNSNMNYLHTGMSKFEPMTKKKAEPSC